MIATLLAAAAPAASSPGSAAASNPMAALCGGQGGMFIPMIMIFVVFYFMLIRPQQKKQKDLQEWLKSLKKGDEVVTNGGVIGKISGLTENTVTLEVQEKVRMKFLRSHIAGKAPAPGQPGPEPEKK
ncbi:MAG: preprotein translocase subunit YajC [Polyangia bacterium]|jgi:preprotein translocase subunit YajC